MPEVTLPEMIESVSVVTSYVKTTRKQCWSLLLLEHHAWRQNTGSGGACICSKFLQFYYSFVRRNTKVYTVWPEGALHFEHVITVWVRDVRLQNVSTILLIRLLAVQLNCQGTQLSTDTGHIVSNHQVPGLPMFVSAIQLSMHLTASAAHSPTIAHGP